MIAIFNHTGALSRSEVRQRLNSHVNIHGFLKVQYRAFLLLLRPPPPQHIDCAYNTIQLRTFWPEPNDVSLHVRRTFAYTP